MKGIPIDEINPAVLLKAGILSSQIDSKILALAKVLNALRLESYSDSVWAVEHTLELLKGKETTPLSYSDTVIEVTSQAFGCNVVDMKSAGRSAELSLARQVVYYLLWKSQKYTLGAIGQLLGDRHPSTVSHGYQLLITKMKSDKQLESEVNKLLEKSIL